MGRQTKSNAMVVLGSKGGLARAKSLSPEERSAIAKRAAEEKWAAIKGLPNETHTGVLRLGAGIPCSVLDNTMRVLSVNGLSRTFGSGAKGRASAEADAPPVPAFLSAANVQPYISAELKEQMANPVAYRSRTGGRPALGYEATILRKMCDALLDARAAGVLRLTQLPTAHAAEVLIRAFADVGIIALIDEATGYQYDRASDELRRLVEAYVVEDMRPWAKLFPDAFFKQVYRVHGWQYKAGVTQGPRYVGKFINKYVYSRLPPPVLTRLRELSPVINKRRKYHLHRFLTEEIGEPTVDRHIASVVTLLSVSNGKTHFDDMFQVAFPAVGEQTVMSAVVNPPTLPVASTDADGDAQEDGEVIHAAMESTLEVDTPTTDSIDVMPGVVMSDVVGGVRERTIAALRERGQIKSTELADLVYGDHSEPTMSKLRVRLGQYRREGIVESTAKGIWRLR